MDESGGRTKVGDTFVAEFADMMRRKLRLGHEIEQRIQAHGRLEHDGWRAEADLARLVSELQVMDHHRQRLESRAESLRAELLQIQGEYTEGASVLTALTAEHQALAAAERDSLQECVDQTEDCPGCGRPAEQLTWTWVELFGAGRVSGWRAVCPDCREDVAFFSVE